IAGLGLVSDVQDYFDREADKLAKAWLSTHRAEIKALGDDRKESYRQIVEMSSDPQDVELVKPEAKFEPTKALENGHETDLPTWKSHLLCDKDRKYPAELNGWERKVLETESKRDGFKFWYRNPQQPGQSSLGIAYIEADQHKVVRPDFVFFVEHEGQFAADLVDPHGSQYADALPKLQGLASYAENHPTAYRRVESVAEANGVLRVLDLRRSEVRDAIRKATEAGALFRSTFASDYA
ncbi:MAG: type III restriction endonuclease subunit R, partial [Verrucomicrobiaceae bacterium]